MFTNIVTHFTSLGSTPMITAITSLFVGVFGIIVWALRLEGRVNTVEKLSDQKSADLDKFLTAQFDDVKGRLDRIENAIIQHTASYNRKG